MAPRKCLKCSSSASFSTCSKAEFCRKHAPKNAFKVYGVKCEVFGCKNSANYGKKEDNVFVVKYCRFHAPEDFKITKRSDICSFEGCNIVGHFVDNHKYRYCFGHKPESSISVSYFYCCEKDCKNYGYYSKDREFYYCKKHAPSGSINTQFSNFCKFEECKKPAHYGLKDTGDKEFCFKHAPANYIRLEKCKTPFCFNFAEEREKHCSEHIVYNYEYEDIQL